MLNVTLLCYDHFQNGFLRFPLWAKKTTTKKPQNEQRNNSHKKTCNKHRPYWKAQINAIQLNIYANDISMKNKNHFLKGCTLWSIWKQPQINSHHLRHEIHSQFLPTRSLYSCSISIMRNSAKATVAVNKT